MSDVDRRYIGVEETQNTIDKLVKEIVYLEYRLKNCKDENIAKSLRIMIENRRRVLEVLTSSD